MSYQDRIVICQDCGQPFTFSADDQAYHAEKGYAKEPKRCPTCRRARRGDRDYGAFSGGYGRSRRDMYPAVCAQCGKQTEVPFRPRGDRPVYCSDCFSQQRVSARRY